MKKPLTYLGLHLARFQFRSEFETPHDLSRFFTGARNVLVVMPRGYDNAVHASNALVKYREQLGDVHLTIIHSGTRETRLTSFVHSKIVRINPADINKLSLPTKGLMQQIFTREYDAAIDLNLDFVLHAAYICRASHAKARVGFARGSLADAFFNVRIEMNKRKAPQAVYENFATALMMF